MLLQKALKEKKKLINKINKTKTLIRDKNSYREGTNVPENFNVKKLMDSLNGDLSDLITLKMMINQANIEIQPYIYQLSEYKDYIKFLRDIKTQEGDFSDFNNHFFTQKTQISELEILELIDEYERKIELLQEEIDKYNYRTEIPWDN